ncbi:MAG: cytochrome c peroxidase [Methylococcales bacterium]|nr:cytochrome c peroxidase [Methylococcales bacterium]
MNKNYVGVFAFSFFISLLWTSEVNAHGDTAQSLQGISVPPTPGLLDGNSPIVIDKNAAIQLGKALFWDTAVSSDGSVACASCHFHAGADARTQNTLSPGTLHQQTTGKTFEKTASNENGGTNYILKTDDFPFHQLSDPHDKNSTVLFNTDEVVGSAGVFSRRVNGENKADSDTDTCASLKDGIFHAGTLNTRQVTNRQAPSVINAAFNFRNFWDGRANNIFNGVSPFGLRDKKAAIWVTQENGKTLKQKISLENASLASQAVGPVLNEVEMSCLKRLFPDVGRKLLPRKPLSAQEIHEQDSVLANLRDTSGKGLTTTYQELVKTAFAPRYWDGSGNFGKPKTLNAAPYNQMEANFSFFFGIALQLYQETLISDQTAFDTPRIAGTTPQIPEGLDEHQANGLKVFLDAHCAICHKGPTFSAAAHPNVFAPSATPETFKLVNRKTLNGAFEGKGVVQAIMDEGYANTSVTPDDYDLGVGSTDPFGNPLSFSDQYMQQLLKGKALIDPIIVNTCSFDNPFILDFNYKELRDDSYAGNCDEIEDYAKIPKLPILQAELKKLNQGRVFVGTKGAFKIPSLRNVELTAPYMHNGSMLTLEQVVDFYFRGGNFNNPAHFATVVFPQPISEQEKADLVAFLKSLTDERVRWERAPFDHPQIKIPHGHTLTANVKDKKQAQDLFLDVPAVGRNGRDANLGALQPLSTYLN